MKVRLMNVSETRGAGGVYFIGFSENNMADVGVKIKTNQCWRKGISLAKQTNKLITRFCLFWADVTLQETCQVSHPDSPAQVYAERFT